MPHGIPIDAYMNKGPKFELIVLDRTRIGVPEIPDIAGGAEEKASWGLLRGLM